MLTKRISDEAVAVTAEEPDDLLALRRVVAAGDRVVSETTRVIKLDREYARPDSGQRVRIRIAIDVESSSLDSQLDRLRIRGVIAESSNESVSHGSHHSVVVSPGERIVLSKRRWSQLAAAPARGRARRGRVCAGRSRHVRVRHREAEGDAPARAARHPLRVQRQEVQGAV